MRLFHRHKWDTLRTRTGSYHNGARFTDASQKCWHCGKTRQKRYNGNFTPEEIDA